MSKFKHQSISIETYLCPACAINRGFCDNIHVERFGIKHQHICKDCGKSYYEEDYKFMEKNNL